MVFLGRGHNTPDTVVDDVVVVVVVSGGGGGVAGIACDFANNEH